ncbi:SH3 domain-containing protein [Oceanibium sediminis]|uniref:SH3 domain-containing protein n=1 Tax=Oceanibium sediminis TaxID=2026339 RepID=UPI001300408E|nr:SH3 domain-containing protein [Oceanibium sediminis]
MANLPGARPDSTLLASSRADFSLIRDIAVAEGIDILPGAGDDIPLAKLEPVTFNRDGTEQQMARARAAADLADTAETATGVVTAEALNLRAGPGTSNAVVARALRGESYSLTGESDGKWVQVSGHGLSQPAWAHGDYLSITR